MVCMSLNECIHVLKGKGAANTEQWRMVRRLFWLISRVMGGFKGEEVDTWYIDGDTKTAQISEEKISEWKEKIKTVKWLNK
jgi:hypothetical protein